MAYFVNVITVDGGIEHLVEFVEEFNGLTGCTQCRQVSEAYNVAEKHGSALVLLRWRLFAGLQLGNDVGRQQLPQ